MKPDTSEYNPYFQKYIDLVNSDNLLEELENIQVETQKILATISEDLEEFRYADGKWSIKELVVHLIDCERVFNYRALCFARNDKTELPGFDEDAYAQHSNVTNRTLKDIVEEFQIVRNSTISLFKSFNEDVFTNGGLANGGKLTVGSLGFSICGHEIHHMNVLKEKYLNIKTIKN